MHISAYVYVDGESHYIGAERTWRALHGEHATLDTLQPSKDIIRGGDMTHFPDKPRITAHHPAKFFWDAHLIWNMVAVHGACRTVHRAVYFTGMPGNPDDIFRAQEIIRKAGFEPVVASEPGQKAKGRGNRLKNENLLIKPKGVDISLAVRMLEDAHNDNYDQCWLLTSDVDMLPAVRAVRRMGKRVWVLGYGEQVGKNSAFRYEPDWFVDLAESYFSSEYKLDEEAVRLNKKKAAQASDQAPVQGAERPGQMGQ